MGFRTFTQHLTTKLLIFQQSETKFVWILAALLVLIVLNPLLSTLTSGQWLLNLLFTFIIVSGILAAQDERQIIRQLLVIGLFSLLLDWIRSFRSDENTVLSIVVFALYSLFMGIVTIATILAVSKSKKVTGNNICGAIAGYLLIGLTFALLATLIETLQPGSFSNGEQAIPLSDRFDALLYFSLVTLFTIGYGDVLPQTAIAQSFAVTLGLIGQIYLTVLVAMLVGKYLKD